MTYSFVKRVDYYFDEYGPQNTENVIKAVIERMRETGIKTIIVASDSGKTAVKVCEAVKNLNVKVIAVSWKTMDPQNVKKLKEHNAIIIENSHTPLSTEDKKKIANTYYTLGQGLKVAVEVTLIAKA